MTVAAVVLFSTTESALGDVLGLPAARRIVDAAWSGGAVPVVVVAPDTSGAVATALSGSSAILAEPAPGSGGPAAQMARGLDVARGAVSDTEAALIWPGAMVWIGPETVTSLIEAYGPDRSALLRPAYAGDAGWPALLPMALRPALGTLSAGLMPEEIVRSLAEIGAPVRSLDLGDPGVTHDRSTPSDDLPAYEGPATPVAGPPPDWGPAAADAPDEGPLEGPTLAPYGQVADADRV